MQNLKAAIIRLAHAHPEFRGDLLPLLKDESEPNEELGLHKLAYGPDTADFIQWAIMRNDRMNEAQCVALLEKMGMELLAESPKSKTGPLSAGESVAPDKDKNANEMNRDECIHWHDVIGKVYQVGHDERGDFVVVDFDKPGGNRVRFEGGGTGAKTGLFRKFRAPLDPNVKGMMEAIYVSDADGPPPSPKQIEQVRLYVEKALGNPRSFLYHSGPPHTLATGKDGTVYFRISSQQRQNDFRSMNPSKGKVLYLGQFNKRPGGWKAQFAALQAKGGEG